MPNIPWSQDEYILDEKEKTVWLRGNFMRSMALHHRTDDPVPGYQVKLVAPSTMEKLKNDPEYLDQLKQTIKEQQMPKKNDPLTLEEIQAASDTFFPLFNEVYSRMPDGSTTEDTLKVMESIAKLGHRTRADKLLDEKSIAFGFNKDKEDNEA